MLDIIHIHGFKCAGTTFSSIMNNNYSDQMICIESKNDKRFDWRNIDLDLLVEKKCLSSHLMSIPSEGEIAKKIIFFIREPIARTISSFVFRKSRGEFPKEYSFDNFCKDRLDTNNSNYQWKLLSNQSFLGKQKGWSSEMENNLNRPDIFFGIVDMFDESLVLLEEELQKINLNLDLSYGKSLNVSRTKKIFEFNDEYRNLIKFDQLIYDKFKDKLIKKINSDQKFPEKLENFKIRCRKIKSPFKVQEHDEWLLI